MLQCNIGYIFANQNEVGSRKEIKKPCLCMTRLYEYGALGRIRTFDRLVRSQVLYPAELRARNLVYAVKIDFIVNMARPGGFEPPTAWFVARYSIQLS